MRARARVCVCCRVCVYVCTHAYTACILSPQNSPIPFPSKHLSKFTLIFFLSFQTLEELVEKEEVDAEGKENSVSKRSKTLVDFPLSWDDQVSRPEVKVISARPTPRDNNREVRSFVDVVIIVAFVL